MGKALGKQDYYKFSHELFAELESIDVKMADAPELTNMPKQQEYSPRV